MFVAPRYRNPLGRQNRHFGLVWTRFLAFFRVSQPLLRPQDAITPCGDNNRLARTRLASANRRNNCAVFLRRPRYRTLRCRNRFFTTWNGCSTIARSCALDRSSARYYRRQRTSSDPKQLSSMTIRPAAGHLWMYSDYDANCRSSGSCGATWWALWNVWIERQRLPSTNGEFFCHPDGRIDGLSNDPFLLPTRERNSTAGETRLCSHVSPPYC